MTFISVTQIFFRIITVLFGVLGVVHMEAIILQFSIVRRGTADYLYIHYTEGRLFPFSRLCFLWEAETSDFLLRLFLFLVISG